MFIRYKTRDGVHYYQVVENYRILGSDTPQQMTVEYLGKYEDAVEAIKRSKKIPAAKKERFLGRIAQLEERVKLALPILEETYQVIVCDPPWYYELRSDDKTHRNKIDYPPMKLKDILKLPIPKLSDRQGCVLWLWTTNNHMGDAFKCLDKWGYELKTILTWEKVTKAGEPHLGTGHWLRNCTEHCLLGVRGEVSSFSHQKTLTNQPTILRARRRQHSRKPEEFYKLVETLSPDATKLEMFARQTRQGWQSWGNEVNKFD